MCDGRVAVDREGSLGQNRRHAASVAARQDERILEVVARDAAPASLVDVELQLDVEPLTRAPLPRPVRAWVRYGTVPVEVDAEAVAWTSRAAAVRWKVGPERVDRAWVWASAVTPRGND